MTQTNTSDNFAREVLKVVVVQICKEMGCTAIHQLALETLTDILDNCMHHGSSNIHFSLDITNIGERTHAYSELSSRTESNLHDLRATLKSIVLMLALFV